MKNPSRRAFLGGRTPELSIWQQFLLQVARKVQGNLQPIEQAEEQAILVVAVITDLHHARQLCHAFGIRLCLLGMTGFAEADSSPVLWLDMSALNQLMPVNQEKSQWFMQAGVSMSQLKEVGFVGLAALPDDLLVAQWLAQPSHQSYPLDQLASSGVLHASLLMADGSVSSLGAFGTENTKPLNTAFLRKIVPQLFQLVNSEGVRVEVDHYPHRQRYRWDIFHQSHTEVNLAHLLLGHQGDLGILEWVVIDQSKRLAPKAPHAQELGHSSPRALADQELDSAVKQLFDPDFLFSYA